LVFIVGISLFISAKQFNKHSFSNDLSGKSFVITYKISRIENGNAPVVDQLRVKTVKATGEYRLAIYNLATGTKTERVADQNSVYEIKSNVLQYAGMTWTPEMRKKF